LESKDYLFPLEWPAYVWALNLLYIPVIILVFGRRRAAGLLSRAEIGLVVGCLSLVPVFAVVLAMNATHVALGVQLQSPRLFWMLAFLATIYMVWWLAEGGAFSVRRARAVALAVTVASASRGAYVKIRFSDRPAVQFDIPQNDWGRAMAWARATPAGSGW